MTAKYMMEYKLYTLVDISYTGKFRYTNDDTRNLYLKQQNFNTVIQTIGLRSNIYYYNTPRVIEVSGRLVGFDTDEIIRVWRFDFSTEHDDVFLKNGDPVWHLKEDFHMVPYINDLDELMSQKYAVFVTTGTGINITFFKK